MKLKVLNQRIEYLNNQLRNIKVKKSNFSQAERKRRARNLIILGANFEILGYEKEDTAVILGFLKENIQLIDTKREYYKNIGKELLEKRKAEKDKIKNQEKVKENQEENRQINIEEIKELMSISKKYHISDFIKTNFNKTLWETLTIREFKLIKSNFKENKK